MIVENKLTNELVEVYGVRDQEEYKQFLIYNKEKGEWEWVYADDYQPIIPEGSK